MKEGLSGRPCGAQHGCLVPGREMGKAALACSGVVRSQAGPSHSTCLRFLSVAWGQANMPLFPAAREDRE